MLGDNQTQVGAHAKGGSSSRVLNHYCRRDCSLQIAGDMVAMELWLPSGDNPSDRPSRVYAARQKAARQKLAAEAEFSRQDSGTLHLPRELLVHVYVFIHLFFGPRRPGDLEEWVRRLCAERGFDCVAISYDPLISEKCDILNNTQFSMIRKLAYSGRVDGEHGGSVCATWSRLRHSPGGAPPLRSAANPLDFPGCHPKTKKVCDEVHNSF